MSSYYMCSEPLSTTIVVRSENECHQSSGKYKLLENIGEGGMGSVWIAEQSFPVKRRVAIKMIKADMDSKQVLARFEAERQALAMMDHPNIAKVFDGGITVEQAVDSAAESIATRFSDRPELEAQGMTKQVLAPQQ